jgi:hypothetical protein
LKKQYFALETRDIFELSGNSGRTIRAVRPENTAAIR